MEKKNMLTYGSDSQQREEFSKCKNQWYFLDGLCSGEWEHSWLEGGQEKVSNWRCILKEE